MKVVQDCVAIVSMQVTFEILTAAKFFLLSVIKAVGEFRVT